MKTTVDLPDDLMREMKIRAATQGRKLKDVMADAIRHSLTCEREVTTASSPLVISRSPSGVPFIKCDSTSDRPTPTIEQLQRLIEESQLEEDLHRAGITH